MDIVKRLEEYYERLLNWEGTFSQYFEIAIQRLIMAQLSHERTYNMIMVAGSEMSGVQ